MNGADVFYIIRKGTSGGTADDLDGESTARITPEFSQCRFVVENGSTALWQLNYGTDAASDTVVRPRDYNATTNAKVWKRVSLSGGDSGVIKTKTVTLTNAQILALPSTAIEIIPSPGANKILVPSLVTISWKYISGYTNLDNANVAIQWGAVPGGTASIIILQSAWGILFGDNLDDIISYPSDQNAIYQSQSNNPISVTAANGAGNFTGGNPVNIMKVTVLYTSVDL